MALRNREVRESISNVLGLVHSFRMPRLLFLLTIFCLLLPTPAPAQQARSGPQLVTHLHQVYQGWRTAMVRRDGRAWQRFTSIPRRISVRNRIYSERRPFPQAVFELPAAPPSLTGLKALRVRVKGLTAKAVYFGKVNFSVPGKAPTDNLYLISYQKEGPDWKYNGAEFINLSALPEVRKDLRAGKLDFVDTPDFKPTGILEKAPTALKGPVNYIAKTYVFCPGREVKLKVNGRSDHLFQNTKDAEVVIGGAFPGENRVQYSVKDIPGGDPKAPLTIRIYLMSEIKGQQPIKVMQYQVEDGAKPKNSGTVRFQVSPEMIRRLR